MRYPGPVFRALPLLAPAILLAACRSGGGAGGPRLEASWVGADTGKFAGAARVAWCPTAARLEVTAARDDRGFGLVLYADGDLAPGSYPGFDPGIDTIHRPGAAAAVRWFTEQKIEGFQSDSGTLELSGRDSLYQARFAFRLRSIDSDDTLLVTGGATGLVPGPCPADSVPYTAPVQ